MKIFGLSDLHFDVNKSIERTNAVLSLEDHPNDILLIPGDVAEARSFFPRLYNVVNPSRSFEGLQPSTTKEQMVNLCKRFKEVIYIPGNHEYYGSVVEEVMPDLCNELSDIHNLHVVNNEEIIIDDKVRILATTLWTDMKRSDPMVIQGCKYYMNDYDYIKVQNPESSKSTMSARRTLQPSDTIRFHEEALEFLKEKLAIPMTIPTVVMTHHAPIMAHANPRRRGNNIADYAYACTDMDDLVKDSDVILWYHGHTHDVKVTDLGNTVIATFARGYYGNSVEPVELVDLEEQSVVGDVGNILERYTPE